MQTNFKIGDKVLFLPGAAYGSRPFPECERGTITGFSTGLRPRLSTIKAYDHKNFGGPMIQSHPIIVKWDKKQFRLAISSISPSDLIKLDDL